MCWSYRLLINITEHFQIDYVLEKHFITERFSIILKRYFFWKEYQFSSDTIFNRIALFSVVLCFGIHVRTHYDLDFFLNVLLLTDLPTKYFQTCIFFPNLNSICIFMILKIAVIFILLDCFRVHKIQQTSWAAENKIMIYWCHIFY